MPQDHELESAGAREDVRVATRRQLIDGQGDAWEVYEFGARRRSGRNTPPVLIFETSTRWRGVKSYPADWAQLPDADLLALSQRP